MAYTERKNMYIHTYLLKSNLFLSSSYFTDEMSSLFQNCLCMYISLCKAECCPLKYKMTEDIHTNKNVHSFIALIIYNAKIRFGRVEFTKWFFLLPRMFISGLALLLFFCVFPKLFFLLLYLHLSGCIRMCQMN